MVKIENIIVYSCIFNNYDKIQEPLFIEPNVSYYLFSDKIIPNLKYWKLILIDYTKLDLDPQRAARLIKLNPNNFLPKHNISIWIDSCYQIRINNLKMFITLNLQDKDICLFKHPKRNCVYEEIKVCKEKKLDHSNLLEKQQEKYLKEGFPRNFGLYHTAFLIRKNNEFTNKFNKLWWKELNKFSKRDQISFSYCLWKLNYIPNTIGNYFGPNLYHSNQFKKYKHIKKREIYD